MDTVASALFGISVILIIILLGMLRDFSKKQRKDRMEIKALKRIIREKEKAVITFKI